IMRISLGVGSRLPAYCTALGRLLLADLPDAEVRARLEASDLVPLTRHTLTDIDALMAKIQQARRQRWSLLNQELEEGLISIAAPIVDRNGRTIAAINISGQANRTSAKLMQESMLPALRQAAERISQML